MKLLFLVFSSVLAFASTQILFGGDKATILMLAMTTNPDASGFYQKLTAPVEVVNGKETKRFQFKDATGNAAVDVVCAFSALAPQTGSCITILHESKGLLMDSSKQMAHYHVSGDEAKSLMTNFVAGTSSEIFRSSDGRFVVKVGADGADINYN